MKCRPRGQSRRRRTRAATHVPIEGIESVAILRLIAPVVVALARLATPLPSPAQEVTADAPAAAVPFGVGERLDYEVSLGIFHVGTGSFFVNGIETVRGHTTYRLEMKLRGGKLGMRVDDDMTSWMDVSSLISRRFQQDQHEVRYNRQRTLEFFPEDKRYFQPDKNEHGDIATDQPLDDISFLYYVRTLPLDVGKEYTLNRYFDPKGNPVRIRVTRRDTIQVPAGKFATIVVQPEIQTKGLFGKGGKAEVYFTDDDRRLVVQVRSSVPVVGHLNMYLAKYTPGQKYTNTLAAPGR